MGIKKVILYIFFTLVVFYSEVYACDSDLDCGRGSECVRARWGRPGACLPKEKGQRAGEGMVELTRQYGNRKAQGLGSGFSKFLEKKNEIETQKELMRYQHQLEMQSAQYNAELENINNARSQQYGFVCEMCGRTFTGSDTHLQYQDIICPFDNHRQNLQLAAQRYTQTLQQPAQSYNQKQFTYERFKNKDTAQGKLNGYLNSIENFPQGEIFNSEIVKGPYLRPVLNSLGVGQFTEVLVDEDDNTYYIFKRLQ